MSTAEIAYEIGTCYGETEQLHTWKVQDEQGVASELYARMDDLVICNVETRADRRGEGLARALYEAAVIQFPTLRHDLPAHRTPEGDAFAQAMGGDEADECTIDYCVCSDDTDY